VADDLTEQASIAVAAEVARRLAARLGLSDGAAAIVAVIDSMEAAQWPAVPIEELIARVRATDRQTLERDLGMLRATGMVVATDAGLSLGTAARRALAGLPLSTPKHAKTWRGRGARDDALAATLAAPYGAAVISGGTPARRLDAVIDAARGPVLAVSSPTRELLCEASLRGLLVAIADADAETIEIAAQSYARVALLVEREVAGEALARIRRRRDAVDWRIDVGRSMGRVRKPPRALAALVTRGWNGTPRKGPTSRVAVLRGSDGAIVRAARTVARANQTTLRELDLACAAPLARAREALCHGMGVVLFVHGAALDSAAVEALGVMLAQVVTVVLIAHEDGLPTALTALAELDVDVEREVRS
jgi:hypothetical protein